MISFISRPVSSVFTPRSLQQRTILYVLLPVLLILLLVGGIGYLLVRDALIEQWQHTAITKLGRSAQMIDLRLGRPKRLLMLFQAEADKGINRHVAEFLIGRIRNLDGVVSVDFTWFGEPGRNGGGGRGQFSSRSLTGMKYHHMGNLKVSKPEYDELLEDEIVSLVSEFRDEGGEVLGRVEVKIAFYGLVDEALMKDESWASHDLFLVDHNGNVLTRTKLLKEEAVESLEKFGGFGQLEQETFEQLRQNNYGTVFGPGWPPERVSGFYRLAEAPWTIVVITRGEMILQPILKFRFSFLLTGVVGILLALFFIRQGTTGTTRDIGRVSEAAKKLAAGDFSESLEVRGDDEVGELTRNFNVMTSQLEERMQLQEAMSIAREVQQNLLPKVSYTGGGVSISGTSVYCQETGGDYFDLLVDRYNPQRVNVVVADVVGHGIGAALLMATVRSLVRCRSFLPGDLLEVITDVNTLLCEDTKNSGNFVTLFSCVVDREHKRLDWVRCGHDPAIVYDVKEQRFYELRGEGIVLGVDGEFNFTQNSFTIADDSELVILIGSDGVWETFNSRKELFGRQRVQESIAANSHLPPEKIIAAVIGEIETFRAGEPQSDDITMVVIKVCS